MTVKQWRFRIGIWLTLGSRISVVKVNSEHKNEKKYAKKRKEMLWLSWDCEAAIWRVGIIIIISGITHILFCFSFTISNEQSLSLKFFLSSTRFVRKYIQILLCIVDLISGQSAHLPVHCCFLLLILNRNDFYALIRCSREQSVQTIGSVIPKQRKSNME